MTPQRAEVLFTATDWAYTIPAQTYTGVHPKERICWVHQSDAQDTPLRGFGMSGVCLIQNSPTAMTDPLGSKIAECYLRFRLHNSNATSV